MAVLVPPTKPVSVKKTAEPIFQIELNHARNSSAITAGCDIASGILSIHWHGKQAVIQLNREPYFEAPDKQRAEEIAPRVYIESEAHLETFFEALRNREAMGCLDNAQRIRQSIAERFPFPPGQAFYIRFGDYATSGFIDLTNDFRLKVVLPVYSSADSPVVTGYRTDYYQVVSEPQGIRVRISPVAASSSVRFGGDTAEKQSFSPRVSFPEPFAFLRLAFRARESSGTLAATLLSSADAALLQAATLQLQKVNSCAFVHPPGVVCMVPPRYVAINPEFPIRLNTKQIYVPVGATLANVMPFSRTSPTPSRLQIRRVFRGRAIPVKFDPSSGDIRNFMLMPKDDIRWQNNAQNNR